MLNLNYSNQVERLSEKLFSRLREPSDDPLRAEPVVVAHGSMGRWLAQRKAARDGVCANVDFLYPAAAIWRLMRAAKPDLPVENPYQPEVLALRIMEHFDDASRAPELEPLARYLRAKDDLGGYRLARRLAACFDQYLVFRPDWILEWEQGAAPHWQAHLWRRLVDAKSWHWARCWQWLRGPGAGAPAEASLPPRLAVFAVPGLSPSFLDCLVRFAAHMEVDIYQFSPSREYWGDAASPRARSASQPPVGNPLLPSLGLPLREMIDWLLEWPSVEWEGYAASCDEHLLGRLQNSLLAFSTPTSPQAVPAARLEVQVCASRRREVEICHDRLQGLFDADPGLSPDEVIVVSPHLDAYLPYVRAIFASIPWVVHGSGPQQGRGAIASVEAIMGVLGRPRLDRSALELLAFPAVRQRFALAQADLADVRRWIREGGLFAGRAGKFSWDLGAERLLAATLMDTPSSDWPAAEQVRGSEAEAIGRFLHFLDALLRLQAEAGRPRPLERWVAWGGTLLSRCLMATAAEEMQLRDVRQALERLAQLQALAAGGRTLEFPIFRELLLAELRAAPQGSAGVAAGVSFASLSAVRLIPARVIYALGVNEGEFPVSQSPSDLDLMAAAPRRGDRLRRQEDRMVFLEWLSGARDHLLLSYVGVDARDGSALAASPLVSELLDHLDCHYRLATPTDAEALPSQGIVTHYPLQPFSGRYGREPGLVSYADYLNVSDDSPSAAPFQRLPIERDRETAISVADLSEFIRLPAKRFVRRTLKIWLDIPEDLLPAEPPLELDALSRYKLVEGLVRECPAEGDGMQARVAAAVPIPEGPTGEAIAGGLIIDVQRLLNRNRALTAGDQGSELRLDFRFGETRLSGRLEGIFETGVVALHAGKIRGKHLLDLWIKHLLLNLAAAEGRASGRTSILVGNGGEASLTPVTDPATDLAALIEIYHQGERSPTPFFPDASRAYAEHAQDRSRARREARKTFTPGLKQPFADGGNAYVRLAFRDQEWLSERFEALAVQVWGPLLEHLEERHE